MKILLMFLGVIVLIPLIYLLVMSVWAVALMFICWYILPLFEINYELTWLQSYGASFIIVLVFSLLRGIVSK